MISVTVCKVVESQGGIMQRTTLCLIAGVLLACATAYAQSGSIAGTITDASGAGVPGAAVTAKNQATASVRTATTDSTGTYSIPNLTVGNYDLSVEKQGFSVLRFHNVSLTVAQNLTLDGSLDLGARTESVDVSASAVPPINLQDAQISNVVDQQRIVDLPLITRDPYQLV